MHFLSLVLFFLAPAFADAPPDFTRFVDTRIGTSFAPSAHQGFASERRGNSQPSAGVPFGMVQWGPDTDHPMFDTESYHFESKRMTGFALTHLSGAGCPNARELSIMPELKGGKKSGRAFSHSDETATAGYYSVLMKNGIQVELTGTERTGFGRFSFPKGAPVLAMDLERLISGPEIGHIRQVSPYRLEGLAAGGPTCLIGTATQVYFAIETDQPILKFTTSLGQARAEFGASTIQVKVGLSYVSTANAWLNLATENPGWAFDAVRASARSSWNAALKKIRVQGAGPDELTTFYTALYHSLLHPNVFSDVNGQYLGFDNKTHQTNESPYYKTHYANFSGWDIYRSEMQLLAVLFPGRASEMAESLVQDARQCGAIPKWAQDNIDQSVMVGDPGPILVADASAFGASNFDRETALGFMKKTALEQGTACAGHEVRPGASDYLKKGYIPQPLISLTGWASTQIEYATADFAISRFAAALGEAGLAHELLVQAASWKNIFDEKSGYVRPRVEGGGWLKPFIPTLGVGFTEGNATQYTWTIPFDAASVIQGVGGKDEAVKKLDFYTSKLNQYEFEPHLWIGNEPDFLAPWLFNWMGAPSKTQTLVTRIRDEVFSAAPGGLPGNDDLGATSSWYIWGTLGLYPAIPGVGGFAVGRPAFPAIRIALDGGTLDLTSHGQGIVQALSVNGSDWSKSWIPWGALANGGSVDFTLGDQPSTWATSDRDLPPSYADFAP
jgi:predicted alpha-1,2-mannosidase